LAVLATSCPGSVVPFILPELSTDPSDKSGFRITVAAATGSVAGLVDCNGATTATSYYSTAVRLSPITGRRGFSSSGSGAIFFDANGVAPTEAQMVLGGGGTTIQ
jgi:hypothetical protein